MLSGACQPFLGITASWLFYTSRHLVSADVLFVCLGGSGRWVVTATKACWGIFFMTDLSMCTLSRSLLKYFAHF